jgi:hypothetical protein
VDILPPRCVPTGRSFGTGTFLTAQASRKEREKAEILKAEINQSKAEGPSGQATFLTTEERLHRLGSAPPAASDADVNAAQKGIADLNLPDGFGYERLRKST